MIPIFLTGMKHCGKSTLGKLLAENIGLVFFDLDKLIEDKISMPIRDYYKEFGQENFKINELQALDNLLLKKNFVCATGGGICDNLKALEKIKETGKIIYIQEEPDILYKRIIRGGIPPFLKSDDPEGEFKNLYNRRSKIYLDKSDIAIKAMGRTPNELLTEILMELRS